VIIGAGDHGRSTLEILRESSRYNGQCEVLGFLDEAPQKLGSAIGGLPVLGGLDWIVTGHRPEIRYVIGIANSRVKQRIARRMADRSLEFVSAVHPSVLMATGVRIAPGAIINAGVAIAYETLIEEHTTINLNATIGHDCIVGRFSTIAPGANIAGKVHVGEGCDVGLNAAVGKGVHIGDWSSIGPGAVVMRNVVPGQSLFGNPARVIHTRSVVSV
jgi:sugar O-acyltransferase (sialic acid O-acetyltransferase NeuD family)